MHRFKKIFVDSQSLKDKATKEILERLKDTPAVEVGDFKAAKEFAMSEFLDALGDGKSLLFLTRNSGEKIKKCPCTKGKIGCGYYVINLHTNCPIDCSYCILQKYLNRPFITLYTNIEEYLEQIGEFLEKGSMRYYRIGTGELTDSLALDDISGYSKLLIDFFSKYENTVLELKTKSDNIDNVLKSKPSKNVILSWSMNPPDLIESDEKLSASLSERLMAAQKCIERGFRVAFHFDPIIIYEGWRVKYAELVENIFSNIEASKIEWISLGALRFDPALKPIMLERFRESSAFRGEFIEGTDNKLRYLRTKRVEAFKHLNSLIKGKSTKPHIYLCMEDEEVWKRVFSE